MNCTVTEKLSAGIIHIYLFLYLLTQLQPTVANKAPSRVPYKAVANLYPIKYSWLPCEEKYCCVIITMKITNNYSVVDNCVFTPTIE